jgi:DEAD/DEAH box helicase domain-containing protein
MDTTETDHDTETEGQSILATDGGNLETDVLALTSDDLAATYPNSRYHEQVHEQFTLPAQDEHCVPAAETLPLQLATKLGFDPWTHQATVLDALGDGENVCVARVCTPIAIGHRIR